jgi:RIO kinase 1
MDIRPLAGAVASPPAERKRASDRSEAERAQDAESTPAVEEEDPFLAPFEDEVFEPLEGGPGTREKEEKWYRLVEDRLSRLERPEGKDRRTMAGVFDQRTLMVLYRLFTGGALHTLDFPISTGKEADVFRATAPEGTYLCAKIYRVATASFHNVLPYIQGDPRFVGVKRDKLSLVTTWAQKEYRNLGRAIDVGVRVPQPLMVSRNVLIMEYIGTEEGPYPLLKDAGLDAPEEVYERIIDDYTTLVTKGRLIHADLSEYNILMTEAGHVIIDIGQAVVLEHPMAQEFFDKDVRNIVKFFTRRGVKGLKEDEVRKRVLGGHQLITQLL